MKRDDGFTLIELLMVVAILGILASIAVMSVLRARSAANEAAAIGTMRTITSGQVTYAATCGRGNYATDLTALGPQPASPVGFLPPDLSSANVVQKSGYRIQIGPSAGDVAMGPDCNGIALQTGYYARSEPLLYGTSGNRSFATSARSPVIWQVYGAASPLEPFAAPATPIQ